MCRAWDVCAVILGEESNYVVHKQYNKAPCSPSADKVGFLEDKYHSGSPSGKSGPKTLLLDSPTGINQFQV